LLACVAICVAIKAMAPVSPGLEKAVKNVQHRGELREQKDLMKQMPPNQQLLRNDITHNTVDLLYVLPESIYPALSLAAAFSQKFPRDAQSTGRLEYTVDSRALDRDDCRPCGVASTGYWSYQIKPRGYSELGLLRRQAIDPAHSCQHQLPRFQHWLQKEGSRLVRGLLRSGESAVLPGEEREGTK
jgi:hypothetical protein